MLFSSIFPLVHTIYLLLLKMREKFSDRSRALNSFRKNLITKTSSFGPLFFFLASEFVPSFNANDCWKSLMFFFRLFHTFCMKNYKKTPKWKKTTMFDAQNNIIVVKAIHHMHPHHGKTMINNNLNLAFIISCGDFMFFPSYFVFIARFLATHARQEKDRWCVCGVLLAHLCLCAWARALISSSSDTLPVVCCFYSSPLEKMCLPLIALTQTPQVTDTQRSFPSFYVNFFVYTKSTYRYDFSRFASFVALTLPFLLILKPNRYLPVDFWWVVCILYFAYIQTAIR